MASLGKLTQNPQVIAMFQDWGYPDHIYLIIGVADLLLAIFLLLSRLLKFAIGGLLVIMIGTAITLIVHDPMQQLIRPALLSTFLPAIYFLNFKTSI